MPPKNPFIFIHPDESCIQMSMQRLHTHGLDLLGRLSCNRTIYHVNRTRGSGPYVGSTISSCAVLQEQSYIRTSGTTYTKSLGIRHDPHCSYLGTTMLRQKQQNPELMSMHATEEGVEQPPENEWVDRFPEVHYVEVRKGRNAEWESVHVPEVHNVEVKRKGRNTGWETVKAIFTQQRAPGDGRARQRRVWISFSGSEPTKEELALGWPQDKQVFTQRKLRDWKEHSGPSELKVTEKSGENGRRFWRETTKRLTDDEEWRDWMREEGNFAEMERIMKKD